MAVLTPAADRLGLWSVGGGLTRGDVGIPFGLDQYLPGGANERPDGGIDVTAAPYNADPTGVVDATSAIAAALNATPPGYALVLPAGDFKSGEIPVPNYRTLRAAGVDPSDGQYRTRLLTIGNTGVSAGSGNADAWALPASNNIITAGCTRGSTVITVGDTSPFVVGRLCKISYSNEVDEDAIAAGMSDIVFGLGGGDYFRCQMVQIAEIISSTQLRITDPIVHPAQAGQTVKIAQAPGIGLYVGVEDIEINATLNNGMIFMARFEQCVGSWIKNVKFKDTRNYHLYMQCCLRCEARSFISDTRLGAGTNGAGLLANTNTSCLFEDFRVFDIFPGIETNQGSCNNVFAYFLLNGALTNINANHGPHNGYDLYEGFSAPNAILDSYFGAASRITFYRGHLRGGNLGEEHTTGICDLKRFSMRCNLWGCNLGSVGRDPDSLPYQFGFPNMGNGDSEDGTSSVVEGDLPRDWKMGGTLTTKLSETDAIITLNSGSLRYYGGQTNGPGQQQVSTLWGRIDILGVNTVGTGGRAIAGDQVPVVVHRLWFIKATRNGAGTLISDWTQPVQVWSHDPDPVQSALQAQFSTDGSSWHFGYSAGDEFMRTRATVGGSYSAAVRIKTEASVGGADYDDYRFNRISTPNYYQEAAPTGDEPTYVNEANATVAWHSEPPAPTRTVGNPGDVTWIFPGLGGFQEINLDVELTISLMANIKMYAVGGPAFIAGQELGTNTIPDSLFRTARPSWWSEEKPWPPYGPQNLSPSYSDTPAGEAFLRYLPPEILSFNVEPNGNAIRMTTTKPCFVGTGGIAGLTTTIPGLSITGVSGEGTTSLLFATSRTILDVETCFASWAGTVNGIEDEGGNDLPLKSGVFIQNFSTQTGGAVWIEAYDTSVPGNNNGTMMYPFAGLSWIQRITVAQAGLAVSARMLVDSVDPINGKAALYRASDLSLVTNGAHVVSEDGNYSIFPLSSVHITPGDYFVVFSFQANATPVVKIKTGQPTNSSLLDSTSAPTYNSFPAATLIPEAGGFSSKFSFGLRLVPDVVIPALRSARAPRFAIPRT